MEVARSCRPTCIRLRNSTIGFHTSAKPSLTVDFTDSQAFWYHVSASCLAVSVWACTVSRLSATCTISWALSSRRLFTSVWLLLNIISVLFAIISVGKETTLVKGDHQRITMTRPNGRSNGIISIFLSPDIISYDLTAKKMSMKMADSACASAINAS